MFDSPQKPGLNAERQLTHFVQKQRAPVCMLEDTDLRVSGLRERAALMAKQLALEERSRPPRSS